MRFMIIVPPRPDSEQRLTGTEQQFADMQDYNEELLRAGVFVDGQGLHPTSQGARVTWEDGDWVVTDGPFAEAKELIAGFTIIDVSSREEALEWAEEVAALVRADPGQALELRQVFAAEDFGDEFTPGAAGARGADARRGRPQRRPRLSGRPAERLTAAGCRGRHRVRATVVGVSSTADQTDEPTHPPGSPTTSSARSRRSGAWRPPR